jgi:N-acyl-D-amino-acid deacylase
VRYHLGDGLFDGFREAVNIGMQSGCPVHISHYSTRLQLRGRADRMLEFIDEARAGGCDLTFDAYPYEATSTSITSALPQWSHSGGPHELIRRLQDKDERERMRREPARSFSEIDKMIVSAVRTEKNKWCQGLTVAEVAEKMKKDTWETICYLMLEENLEVAFFSVSGNMNDVKGIMMHPAHMFISDGLRIGDVPNPRTYGSFPRVLGQLVRDEKVMPLEQAIRKMTSFPAQRFGLRDRGILRDGMKADIVVFNPALVSGTATFINPKQFPIGIDYVLVNGKLVIERGRHTGRLPGEPLTRRS